MKVFVIDVNLCVGCYACQFVCKDEHVGNDWSPIAKPQPDTGQFWMRLDEYICGTVPKVKMHYIPNPCMHCDEPPCIPPCPIEGAIYKREDGLVIIDSVKCTGCRSALTCALTTPFTSTTTSTWRRSVLVRPSAGRRRMDDPQMRRRMPD